MPLAIATENSVRRIDVTSARAFFRRHGAYLAGRVLCLGGDPPREAIVGDCIELEDGRPLPGGYFDAVVAGQFLECAADPVETLRWSCRAMLRIGGALVFTYRTCWEDQPGDLWRFTRAGMERLLQEAAFRIVVHEPRGSIAAGGFRFPLGYGVVAIK